MYKDLLSGKVDKEIMEMNGGLRDGSHIDGNLDYNRGGVSTNHWEKKKSIDHDGTTGCHMRNIKLNPFLIPYSNIDSRYIFLT